MNGIVVKVFFIVVLIMAILNFYRVWSLHAWFEYYQECMFSFGGIVCYLLPDITSEWTAHYGWTRNKLSYFPEYAIRPIGFFMVLFSFYTLWLA